MQARIRARCVEVSAYLGKSRYGSVSLHSASTTDAQAIRAGGHLGSAHQRQRRGGYKLAVDNTVSLMPARREPRWTRGVRGSSERVLRRRAVTGVEYLGSEGWLRGERHRGCTNAPGRSCRAPPCDSGRGLMMYGRRRAVAVAEATRRRHCSGVKEQPREALHILWRCLKRSSLVPEGAFS